MSEELRKPGRPALKKGKPTWKPASILDVTDKEDGFRYRWSRKDPENLAKKAVEGWETVTGNQADKSKHVESGHDGSAMTTVRERQDCILQRIPEDVARERDAYINNETKRRTQGLTAHLKNNLKDKSGTPAVHGEITISSLREQQTVD